jgi:hypothetical protein
MCVRQQYAQLASRAEKVFDNGLFEAFDLTMPASDALARDPAMTPPNAAVTRVASTGLLVTWDTLTGIEEYQLEMKERPAEPFEWVGRVDHKGNGLLVTPMDPSTRYFFRVRACTQLRCSPYAYLEGRTGP